MLLILFYAVRPAPQILHIQCRVDKAVNSPALVCVASHGLDDLETFMILTLIIIQSPTVW